MTCARALPRNWKRNHRSLAVGWISCGPVTSASKTSRTRRNAPPHWEKEAVLVSLENLMTFPFVKSAVD